MKTLLITCLFVIISGLSIAQEQDYKWLTDGSLVVGSASQTFTSPIVKSKERIKENEMVLVNLNNYRGEDQANINYGIYSKDLGSDGATTLKVFHRKKIDTSNPNTSPLFGFEFTHDNHLIYGCKTSPNYNSSFTNQEDSWNVHGYYAHGYSFSKTQIKSTDYKLLWNRPKSTTWWDTLYDVTIGAIIVVVVVATIALTAGAASFIYGVGASIAGVSITASAGTIAASGLLSGLGLLTLAGIYQHNGYILRDSNSDGYEWLIPQEKFETNMEIILPDKISAPDTSLKRKWNKSIEAHLKNSINCTDFPNKKCYKIPFTEVVVQMQVKNSHIRYVNIPGEIHKNITAYQLFKNYQYTTDQTGLVIADTKTKGEVKLASDVFDTKDQILPSKLFYPNHKTTTLISLKNFKGIPTYYLISKDIPEMNSLFYKDLGVYGKIGDDEYKLYRFQTNVDYSQAIAIETGPKGPFLAGDNIQIKNDTDITVSVYRFDYVNPVIEEGFSFSNNSNSSQINFQAGDSVVFTTKHKDFLLDGIPEIWLARAAGESKYYCTPSITPDTYKPFLGFDSQVHGVAVRKYSDGYKKKTPQVVHDTEAGLYSWYWIAQRRMDPNIKDNTLLANQNVQFKKYKTAKNFGTQTGFSIGGGIKITKQRNNQREGYNMQLLYAWKKEGESIPVFKEYGGSDFIVGTDPDEIVYLGSNGAKIPSAHSNVPIPQALLKIDIEEWKRLPEGENSDPINEMVTAYQKNRNYVNGDLYDAIPDYNGYEILDMGMYKEHTIDGLSNTKPCNGKPCVKFFKDGLGEENDNNKAPGNFTFSISNDSDSDIDTKLSIPVSLKSPQATDSGFYGSIEGDQWPSEWQKNVPYSFTGLSGLTSQVLNTLVMEYTHENELGILTKDTRYYRNSRTVSNNGNWKEYFDLKGWGYNEITVYVQRKPNATMVPIAGMELLEVMIRFVSAPGSKWQDFSPIAFNGIDLKEGRGEGNFWYLRDANKDVSNRPEYGNPQDDINKSYTLSKGDRIVFTAMDSDPHTFFHYDAEWYLSERFMAKRILPEELDTRIHWFLAPFDYDGLGDLIHTGRWLDTTFDTPGKYNLTAVYGKNFDKNSDLYGHTRMSHEITVLPNKYAKEATTDKGVINIHPLSPDQTLWLQKKNPEINSSWRVAEVDDIFSQWTHIDGPRAEPPNDKPNRYGTHNDYNAHFKWYQNPPKLNDNPSRLPLKKITIEDPNLKWFPKNWIRHYSGSRIPKDMKLSEVNLKITSTPKEIDAELNKAFPLNTPESWQWRLPWVSLTNWQGYRTRANIKVVFNMKKLFDNQIGAFSGEGVKDLTDKAYANSVSNPLPKLTDQEKSNYDFYLDLLSGRKVIYDTSNTNPDHFSVYQVDDYEDEMILDNNDPQVIVNSSTKSSATTPTLFLEGADMSSIKNLEEEEISWSKSGSKIDPYELLSSSGANVVRFRLWVDPKKSDGSAYHYSTLPSVANEIIRAKKKNLKVLLDLHYSDAWTDPKQNIIPSSWVLSTTSSASHTEQLEKYLSNYTTAVLKQLQEKKALPDMIQIGNETNNNLLLTAPYSQLTLEQIASQLGLTKEQMKGSKYTINWDRNAPLFNAGLSAVRAFSPTIETMLHIAGPLTAQWWTNQAFNSEAAGRVGKALIDLEKVDIIGLSYYPGEEEQKQSIPTVKNSIENIGTLYKKKVLIVETAFPHTYGWSDNTTNLFGETKHGAWPEKTGASKQLEWLLTLKETLKSSKHSIGFIYWEPFWVGSNTARTKDSVGSSWENMTFFPFQNGKPTKANEVDLKGGINVFSYDKSKQIRKKTAPLKKGDSAVPSRPKEIAVNLDNQFEVFPVPTKDKLTLTFSNNTKKTVELRDLQGRLLFKNIVDGTSYTIATQTLGIGKGILLVRVIFENNIQVKKVIID